MIFMSKENSPGSRNAPLLLFKKRNDSKRKGCPHFLRQPRGILSVFRISVKDSGYVPPDLSIR